jgi:hypothetical protein
LFDGTSDRLSVLARGGKRGDHARTLLLCGHLDVGLDAVADPVEGDRLYGSGAYDAHTKWVSLSATVDRAGILVEAARSFLVH